MKSKKISETAGLKGINSPKGTLFAQVSNVQIDNIIDDLRDITAVVEPVTGVEFTGEISLGKLYTQYSTYTPTTNIAVTLNAIKVIGGSADIRMIGNGTNTPTFAAFTKHPSSGDYVNTLGTINYIVFYFNGTESLYSINQL